MSENRKSMQEVSAISEVSLGIIREKVKPAGIIKNTLYQLAYHGTPHNFDDFSLDNIGTGEGAQAHGWGLYFAKNKTLHAGHKIKVLGITEVSSKEGLLDSTNTFIENIRNLFDNDVKLKNEYPTYNFLFLWNKNKRCGGMGER